MWIGSLNARLHLRMPSGHLKHKKVQPKAPLIAQLHLRMPSEHLKHKKVQPEASLIARLQVGNLKRH